MKTYSFAKTGPVITHCSCVWWGMAFLLWGRLCSTTTLLLIKWACCIPEALLTCFGATPSLYFLKSDSTQPKYYEQRLCVSLCYNGHVGWHRGGTASLAGWLNLCLFVTAAANPIHTSGPVTSLGHVNRQVQKTLPPHICLSRLSSCLKCSSW